MLDAVAGASQTHPRLDSPNPTNDKGMHVTASQRRLAYSVSGALKQNEVRRPRSREPNAPTALQNRM